ncbi:IclR family transcriptional regulator [Variovorax sp. Sphag1AA]|uniref:IclR family transcriptional regulator n=1 Tax=Variovorax sp. Sphag1AA TaxID=2587027 RepID=UPI0016220C6B|nr:IclR family transcriptional regulator [Variovorax sp. Sphag1AA]MBB3177981.1 DNA-binding IclR family transcriptional regulator [Variovorax sp. Sphag1AA]
MMERETGTTARVLMVLRAVAEMQPEPTMKALADRLNLPPSTMHRLLELLAEHGMVERDESTRTFRPAVEFFRIAALVVNRVSIRMLARPYLQAAARAVDESAYLCVYDANGGRMTFAATATCSHLLDYRVPLDTPFSLVTGASGRSILAWVDKVRQDEIIRSEIAAGELDQAARAQLEEALIEVRARGYAQTFGQRIKGAVGIFAPVFDAAGTVTGSLGFTVPEMRYQAALQQTLVSVALEQAAALSGVLGYTQEPDALKRAGDTT